MLRLGSARTVYNTYQLLFLGLIVFYQPHFATPRHSSRHQTAVWIHREINIPDEQLSVELSLAQKPRSQD